MKHIRTFENYRTKSKREEIIKESVFQVNDIYKVKTMIDIPQSLINAYVKKVKDTTGKNLRQFFGDVDIAEEIVKYINMNNLDVEKIPGGALMGGQVQPQTQTEAQPEAQTEVQPQAQTQAQVQTEAQPQAQTEAQPQAQVQTEAQPQAQAQGEEFEEPQAQAQEGAQEEEEKEETEEKEEGGEELPA
jgi:hypothetical protein